MVMASNNIKLEEEVPGIGDKARKGLQPSRFQKRNPHLHIALAVGALPLPSSTGIRVVTTGRCELPAEPWLQETTIVESSLNVSRLPNHSRYPKAVTRTLFHFINLHRFFSL
jgi:hypothetical protein